MRSRKAIRECAEWLAFCLRIGWQRSDLNKLEEIWWQYHDEQGKIDNIETFPRLARLLRSPLWSSPRGGEAIGTGVLRVREGKGGKGEVGGIRRMCDFIQDTHVMPGYVCCSCRTYNGLQRRICKACGNHSHAVEIPDGVKPCPRCGAGYPDELPPRCLACSFPLGGNAQIEQLGGSGLLNTLFRPDQS